MLVCAHMESTIIIVAAMTSWWCAREWTVGKVCVCVVLVLWSRCNSFGPINNCMAHKTQSPSHVHEFHVIGWWWWWWCLHVCCFLYVKSNWQISAAATPFLHLERICTWVCSLGKYVTKRVTSISHTHTHTCKEMGQDPRLHLLRTAILEHVYNPTTTNCQVSSWSLLTLLALDTLCMINGFRGNRVIYRRPATQAAWSPYIFAAFYLFTIRKFRFTTRWECEVSERKFVTTIISTSF